MSDVKVINPVYDAVNDVTVNIAAGTIERISIKRINSDGSPKVTNINSGPNKGKVINSTHRASILLKSGADQVWVSFGTHEVKNLSYENQYQIKVDDKWTDLKEGMVIRVQVQIRTWKDKDTGEERSTPEGKKAKIKIVDSSGAREPSSAPKNGAASQSAASSGNGGKTTKVFGDITAVDGLEVMLTTETGPVKVILSPEQISQLTAGGRLAGQRAEDGKIVAGFKAYGPKGSAPSGGASGGKGTFKKDMSGMETGHALNGALNLRRSGLTVPPVSEVAKVVHDVTKYLKQEASQSPEHKGMSDYDLGAMAGHAVLNATRDIQVGDNDNPEEITGKLLEYSRELLSSVVPAVSSYVKGNVTEPASSAVQEPKLEPKEADKKETGSNGHINMSPPPMDFDEDIPF